MPVDKLDTINAPRYTQTMTDIYQYHEERRALLAKQREQNKHRAEAMLTYRYSTEPPQSYAKIGKEFGLSRQRVEQIINSATKKAKRREATYAEQEAIC